MRNIHRDVMDIFRDGIVLADCRNAIYVRYSILTYFTIFTTGVVDVSTLPLVSVIVTVKTMSLATTCISSRKRSNIQGEAKGFMANHSGMVMILSPPVYAS